MDNYKQNNKKLLIKAIKSNNILKNRDYTLLTFLNAYLSFEEYKEIKKKSIVEALGNIDKSEITKSLNRLIEAGLIIEGDRDEDILAIGYRLYKEEL